MPYKIQFELDTSLIKCKVIFTLVFEALSYSKFKFELSVKKAICNNETPCSSNFFQQATKNFDFAFFMVKTL